MNHANFEIVHTNEKSVTIRDLGPWSGHPTVTNDAEHVVAYLYARGVLDQFKRLFYYDSEGELDEITHANGRFKGFAPTQRSPQ